MVEVPEDEVEVVVVVEEEDDDGQADVDVVVEEEVVVVGQSHGSSMMEMTRVSARGKISAGSMSVTRSKTPTTQLYRFALIGTKHVAIQLENCI